MSRFSLTKRAEDDLQDIFVYGYLTFGVRQAEAYARQLERTFARLADHPRMGREAPNIAPGVRRHECGSHVVLFEETSGGVLVLAIVHSRSVRFLNL